MHFRSALLLLAAALVGAVLANLSRATAESPPAWDRELTRQLIRAQEAQREALENGNRLQERQISALQELGRSIERCHR